MYRKISINKQGKKSLNNGEQQQQQQRAQGVELRVPGVPDQGGADGAAAEEGADWLPPSRGRAR